MVQFVFDAVINRSPIWWKKIMIKLNQFLSTWNKSTDVRIQAFIYENHDCPALFCCINLKAGSFRNIHIILHKIPKGLHYPECLEELGGERLIKQTICMFDI